MWSNIFAGILLIVLTILLHGGITRYVIYLAKRRANTDKKRIKYIIEFQIARIVLILFFASVFEAFIWGLSYIVLGAIQGFEKALYFSIVTFTTLGYGDITLPEGWRLLASFEAATGIIIFGWTTAIVMAVVQKLYFTK